MSRLENARVLLIGVTLAFHKASVATTGASVAAWGGWEGICVWNDYLSAVSGERLVLFVVRPVRGVRGIAVVSTPAGSVKKSHCQIGSWIMMYWFRNVD